nr:unnamed protein product [Naegleria fowleri]
MLPSTSSDPIRLSKKVVISIDFGTSRSGYCYSFKTDSKKTRVKNNEWKDAPKGVRYPKTLTHLLYKKDNLKKPVAWGYSPLELISQEMEDASDDEIEQTSQYFHFKNFKMGLFNNPSKMCSDTTNTVQKNVGELVVDYLRLLYMEEIKPSIEKILRCPLETSQITWCLTVPAIWKDEHKAAMRIAAYEAGLISTKEPSLDDFKIVLEPEGAAAYCMEFQAMKGSALREGQSFLVCDLGGGTVDLTCHSYTKGKLKEICDGDGGDCGSTYLDERFLHYLEECFGVEFVNALKRKYAQTYLEVMKNWEKLKVSTKTIDADVQLEMPNTFPAIVEEEGVVCPKYRNNRRHNYLIITKEALQKIYGPSMSQTAELVSSQLEKVKNNTGKTVDFIFIVGGFGSSEVIQNRLKSLFSSASTQVVVPTEPAEAVVDGAALLGLDDSLICTRRMRLTYGVKVNMKGSKEEIFDTFVSFGQEVEVDQGIERVYKAQRANQQAMKLVFYATKLKSLKVVDETKCRKIGQIIVDMKDTTGGLNRVVVVKMYFGRSETKVEALEKTSGKVYSATIKYDGEIFVSEDSSVPEEEHAESMNHIIFANDISGSMSCSDATPSKDFLRRSHNNRVGALYEACYEFIAQRESSQDICSCILHHHDSILIYEKQPISTSLVKHYMMKYNAGGGNNFKNVFLRVGEVLAHNDHSNYKPIVLFMTDGVWHDDGGTQVLEGLMQKYPDLVVHVICLGNEINKELMQRFATIGRGTFSVSGINLGELKSTYLSLLPLLE